MDLGERKIKMNRHERLKETKLCLSLVGSWFHDTNPWTKSLSNLNIPKKGLRDTISVSWSIKVFFVAVAIVSPIY